jgi:hypothetical protein
MIVGRPRRGGDGGGGSSASRSARRRCIVSICRRSHIRGVTHRGPDFLPPGNRSISHGCLFGLHLLVPPLPPGAHGGQRPGLAILCYGARAAPAVKPATLLTWYGPLAAETVTVPHAGAAALLVFAMGSGLCHLSSDGMH